jgi:putative mRNA 3-end processing factor
MELEFLGGAGEVGRSGLLVNDRLLLDYGMDGGDPPAYPVDAEPEAVVVSHGHLDHTGALPTLVSGDCRPPVHWTPPTDELARRLARDTIKLRGGRYDCPFTEVEVRRLTEVSEHHGYRDPFEAAGHRVEFFDAGHVPGSAHVLVDDGDTRLLYTGDFHTEDTRLLSGTTARPEADVVVTESTYADTEREPRREVERRLVDRLRRTVRGGGTAVVPAFAVGRTQEVLMICESAGLDCYVDGMGVEITRLFRRHPEYVRDPDALARAAGNARVVDGRDGQRRRIADEQTVIVTTSGMLQGGPAMTYVPAIRDHPGNLVALVGYQVEGTPGRDLLDRGSAELDGRVMPVSARTELFDLSAHAGSTGLREFLAAYRDSRVLAVHGDRCEWFADRLRADGFDADAPARGDRLTV